MAGAPQRIVIAITGATGVVYGVRLLEVLRALREQDRSRIETHLLISPAGVLNLKQELGRSRRDVEALADVVHPVRDIGASIASGSFQSLGMIVAPCSMKTLASIAHGFADNLVARAADVALKERRRLVLMVRETPFNLAHIRNMEAVTLMGGVIFPPLPGLYHRPQSIAEMVDHTVGRVLDLFAIEHDLAPRWHGHIGLPADDD